MDVETEDLWIETLVKTVVNSYGFFQEQGINQSNPMDGFNQGNILSIPINIFF